MGGYRMRGQAYQAILIPLIVGISYFANISHSPAVSVGFREQAKHKAQSRCRAGGKAFVRA